MTLISKQVGTILKVIILGDNLRVCGHDEALVSLFHLRHRHCICTSFTRYLCLVLPVLYRI